MVREATATLSSQEAWNGLLPEEPSLEPANEVNGLYDAPPATAGGPGPFALLLGFLVKNDRNEILRIAREIGVSDNTVYRWLNGTSEPRQSHMQRLLEVLPQSRATLPSHSGLPAPGGVRGSANHPGRWDVPKELYRRVMEQAATTVDDTSRRWHIIETIFEYALLHLDPDHHGLALTYARLMPPRADGSIHSLYEAEMRGQAPWPFALDFKAYLGSTPSRGLRQCSSVSIAGALRTQMHAFQSAWTQTSAVPARHQLCAVAVWRAC